MRVRERWCSSGIVIRLSAQRVHVWIPVFFLFISFVRCTSDKAKLSPKSSIRVPHEKDLYLKLRIFIYSKCVLSPCQGVTVWPHTVTITVIVWRMYNNGAQLLKCGQTIHSRQHSSKENTTTQTKHKQVSHLSLLLWPKRVSEGWRPFYRCQHTWHHWLVQIGPDQLSVDKGVIQVLKGNTGHYILVIIYLDKVSWNVYNENQKPEIDKVSWDVYNLFWILDSEQNWCY